MFLGEIKFMICNSPINSQWRHWSRVTVPGKWPFFFFFFGQDMCHDYSVRRWGLGAAVWAQILTLCSGARRRQRRPHGASSRGWCGDGWRVAHRGAGGARSLSPSCSYGKRSARAARRSASSDGSSADSRSCHRPDALRIGTGASPSP